MSDSRVSDVVVEEEMEWRSGDLLGGKKSDFGLKESAGKLWKRR